MKKICDFYIKIIRKDCKKGMKRKRENYTQKYIKYQESFISTRRGSKIEKV